MIKIVGGFFALMVMISAGTVYSLKEATERLDARKAQLSAQILKDRAAIKVLRAEMAYLSQPDRLQKLSERFLALRPARSFQMAEDVRALAGREAMQQVSLPVDAFPVLLPQTKPEVRTKRPDRTVPQTTYSHSAGVRKAAHEVRVQKKAEVKKASFYERISVKLEEEE